MKKLLRALKQWTLLIAIVVGAVGHSFFSQFTWLAPWLLASMLLLTFCNISPRDLRFHPLHLILMSLQIVMSLGLYALTLPWHPAIAQGVCMAALTPTATAAAIITGMLGGSVAFLLLKKLAKNGMLLKMQQELGAKVFDRPVTVAGDSMGIVFLGIIAYLAVLVLVKNVLKATGAAMAMPWVVLALFVAVAAYYYFSHRKESVNA